MVKKQGSKVGKIVYVRLGGKAGRLRAPNGAEQDFLAPDPVSYGDEVIYEQKDGKAVVRGHIKYAMNN